ncbi:hypothetical protein [Pseudooceanicola marinus]|uniref:hypothetical protein n=1 Tax=Pseudooceanicola marinus TaxID=396013 RepID=UPI001CD64AAD|nr:hypothetical protein [Pseudooceanicola marinus]MCA1335463.1 hypothetical protein [Pseudooceanicola marinus]
MLTTCALPAHVDQNPCRFVCQDSPALIGLVEFKSKVRRDVAQWISYDLAVLEPDCLLQYVLQRHFAPEFEGRCFMTAEAGIGARSKASISKRARLSNSLS